MSRLEPAAWFAALLVLCATGCAAEGPCRPPAPALGAPVQVRVLWSPESGDDAARAYTAAMLESLAGRLNAGRSPSERRVVFLLMDDDGAVPAGTEDGGSGPITVLPPGLRSAPWVGRCAGETLFVVPDGRMWTDGQGCWLVGASATLWATAILDAHAVTGLRVDARGDDPLMLALRERAPSEARADAPVVIHRSMLLRAELDYTPERRLLVPFGPDSDLPQSLASRVEPVAVPMPTQSDPALPHGPVSEERWAETVLLYDAAAVAALVARRCAACQRPEFDGVAEAMGSISMSVGPWEFGQREHGRLPELGAMP